MVGGATRASEATELAPDRKSDLFVINKIDLAPHVGADLAMMEADTRRMRGERPFLMTNLETLTGLADVGSFHRNQGHAGLSRCALARSRTRNHGADRLWIRRE